MTWEKYCEEANKTWNPALTGSEALEYIRLKLIEECSEVLGEYTKERFHNKKPDYIGELGDVMWYLAALVNKDITGVEITMILHEGTTLESQYIVDVISDLILFGYNNTYYSMLETLLDTTMEIIKHLGLTNEQVWKHNIAKLRKRHGTSYNTDYYENKKELVW